MHKSKVAESAHPPPWEEEGGEGGWTMIRLQQLRPPSHTPDNWHNWLLEPAVEETAKLELKRFKDPESPPLDLSMHLDHYPVIVETTPYLPTQKSGTGTRKHNWYLHKMLILDTIEANPGFEIEWELAEVFWHTTPQMQEVLK